MVMRNNSFHLITNTSWRLCYAYFFFSHATANIREMVVYQCWKLVLSLWSNAQLKFKFLKEGGCHPRSHEHFIFCSWHFEAVISQPIFSLFLIWLCFFFLCIFAHFSESELIFPWSLECFAFGFFLLESVEYEKAAIRVSLLVLIPGETH